MLGGRRQLLSLPGGPGSSPLEWVRVGRGVCEAPPSGPGGGLAEAADTYLPAHVPSRTRFQAQRGGTWPHGPGVLQGAGRGDNPSGPSQECVWEAAHKTQVGSRRTGPSCEPSEGSEGRADVRPEPLGSARLRSAEGRLLLPWLGPDMLLSPVCPGGVLSGAQGTCLP